MINLRDIRSVTEFQRNIKEYVGKLQEAKSPMVLTLNGRAALVVEGAESYQQLMDRLEKAETLVAISKGLAQAERGEAIPIAEAECRLRKKHGFTR